MTTKGETVSEILHGLQTHFGAAQIIARTVQSQFIEFTSDANGTVESNERLQVLVRRCGTKSTGFQVADQLDLDLLIAKLEGAPRLPPIAARMPVAGQHTAGLDLRLHRNLSDVSVFKELAGSLRSNVLHEGERCNIECQLDGAMRLWRQITFVGAGSELVGAFQGALDTRVNLNGLVGDRMAQVHAPESFLPIALIGARCLQRYGALPGVDGASLTGVSKIILHPRVLETVLRAVPLDALRSTLLRAPECVDCDGLFLVDDPTIEGLWTARGFDDTGTTTARQAFILRGQVAQRMLSIDPPGQEWFAGPLDDEPKTLMPRSSFSGILVGRGESSLQELLIDARVSVVINEWTVTLTAGQAHGFTAEVTQGVLMRGERPVGLIRPGTLCVGGDVFGPDAAVFSRGRLSRELQDTGSAVAPFVETSLRILP